ncbi:uncharacterized protein LOC120359534 isoform X2 [Solenopsis invicta]|uniref:uncharacterized protein LOC120359534 isoform X2 n=1 Tax=Solenopsis invicta TaxID=13686 RepID=UPI00193D6F57|nr:uncharacterized protein LOC120359534 isoform X2 [Solenopsis invicta]
MNYLIELQKLSIIKENIIITKINNLLNCLDKSGPVEIKVNDKNEDNIADLLPIKDLEQLENFEKELQNKEIYNQMVTKLYYRGGKNVDEIVNKIMSLIFTNSLACSYSYFGKKKKKAFSDLVLYAIYHHKFDVKEDYIIKKIGIWLANAPTRQARENMKKQNLAVKNKTSQKEDTDILVLSGNETES